jgi:hypothetical protein
MPEAPPIAVDEWDFTQLAAERLGEALVWEYSRTQEWLVDAVNRGPLKRRPSEKMQPDNVVPLADVLGQRCLMNLETVRLRRSGVARTKAGATGEEKRVTVIDVSARRTFGLPNKNPFLYHNLNLAFSEGFPNLPYLSAPNAAAFLQRFDGMPIRGVHDLV